MSSQWPAEASQQKSRPSWKRGRTNTKVVEVGAAGIGIVEQEGVAFGEPAVLLNLVDDGPDREGHRADKDRQALRALHEGVARRRVIDAVAGVPRFGDDRVEGRAVERRVHLVRDAFEPSFQDRERDRVDDVALVRHGSRPS
jgi:hypothetical protein